MSILDLSRIPEAKEGIRAVMEWLQYTLHDGYTRESTSELVAAIAVEMSLAARFRNFLKNESGSYPRFASMGPSFLQRLQIKDSKLCISDLYHFLIRDGHWSLRSGTDVFR